MKILALEQEVPGARAASFTGSLLADEAQKVWELTQEGTLREIYFRADRRTAVIMLECPDPGTAHAVLSRLPLVEAGLITFEVIPLTPYPGYARLFARSETAAHL